MEFQRVEATGMTGLPGLSTLAEAFAGDARAIGAVATAILAVALLLLPVLLRRSRRRRPRRQWRRRLRVVGGAHGPAARDLGDPAVQMAAIRRVGWSRRPLMNRPETALFRLVEDVVAALPDHRVMAQTSLGELLRTERGGADRDIARAAHASINSKRLDIAVIGPDGLLALAVEYQGRGHHQGDAFMRDAVKREALRRAGAPMLEIEAGADPAIVRARLAEALGLPRPGAPPGPADAPAAGARLQPSG